MKIRYLIVSSMLATGTLYAEDAKEKAPVPAPATTEASAEIKAGTGVENREIVGEAATFPAGTTVWVWSRIKNGQGKAKHIWKRDGTEVWQATLDINSKRWSTQTRRKIPKASSWEVEVQTEDGTSLGSVSFKVE